MRTVAITPAWGGPPELSNDRVVPAAVELLPAELLFPADPDDHHGRRIGTQFQRGQGVEWRKLG